MQVGYSTPRHLAVRQSPSTVCAALRGRAPVTPRLPLCSRPFQSVFVEQHVVCVQFKQLGGWGWGAKGKNSVQTEGRPCYRSPRRAEHRREMRSRWENAKQSSKVLHKEKNTSQRRTHACTVFSSATTPTRRSYTPAACLSACRNSAWKRIGPRRVRLNKRSRRVIKAGRSAAG